MIQEDYIVFKIICLILLSFPVLAENTLNQRAVLRAGSFESFGSFSINNELDIYNGSSYIAPSVSFNTKSRWEFSIQTQNIPIGAGGSQSYENDTYFGVSKFTEINDSNAIIIGSQNGYSFDSTSKILHSFSWIDYKYRPQKWLIFHGGAFYVNQALSTTNAYFGGLAGIELNGEKVKFCLDYYGGHSNVSGAIVSTTYKYSKQFRPYVGVGIPETKSGNEFFGMLGITYNF